VTEKAAPEYVQSFAGYAGESLLLGGRTVGTGYPSGRATVCGRPYSVDGGLVEFDPDGDVRQIEQGLLRLDGKFSLVAQGRKKWVLATDLLGTGGAFLAQTRRGTVIASSLGGAAALADHLEYDMRGLVTALIGSVFLDGVTPFAGVRRLQAAEYALVDLCCRKDPEIRAYADPAEVLIPHGVRPGSPHEFRELLQSAVAREEPDEKTGLLLAGGKDSQAIGNAIERSVRTKVTAFTYGGWRSTDRRESRPVAQRIGVRHERVVLWR
jgi:asparagine synthetase B (glutamine-hydrolysing)